MPPLGHGRLIRPEQVRRATRIVIGQVALLQLGLSRALRSGGRNDASKKEAQARCACSKSVPGKPGAVNRAEKHQH
jgi:hypothetical protein